MISAVDLRPKWPQEVKPKGSSWTLENPPSFTWDVAVVFSMIQFNPKSKHIYKHSEGREHAHMPGHFFKDISLTRITGCPFSDTPTQRDAYPLVISSGETLGFTRRHIDCCFPELQKLAKSGPPQWMVNQINQDLVLLRSFHTSMGLRKGACLDTCVGSSLSTHPSAPVSRQGMSL